ncbi:ribosome-binding factor A [Candidatus Dependentiae bacterium]|nr:ribosome-binding factor A [Candidatus Dependentiae bacterium]
MNPSNLSNIKRSQKESLLLKELSKMLHELMLDDKELSGLFINRVELSKNKGACIVYFYDPQGPSNFETKKRRLILYKPSLRRAIAMTLDGRYTPELVFAYDAQFEKQQRIENILEKVKNDFKKDSNEEE